MRSGLQGAWGGDQQEQTAHCWGGCGIRGYLVVWVQVFLHIWFVLFCAWWWCFISAQAPWDALAKKCWWCSLKSHCKVRRWPKEARVQRAAQVWMDEFQSLVKFASGPLWGPQSWQRQEGAETQPHCIKLLGSCWRSMWSSRCAHAGVYGLAMFCYYAVCHSYLTGSTELWTYILFCASRQSIFGHFQAFPNTPWFLQTAWSTGQPVGWTWSTWSTPYPVRIFKHRCKVGLNKRIWRHASCSPLFRRPLLHESAHQFPFGSSLHAALFLPLVFVDIWR